MTSREEPLAVEKAIRAIENFRRNRMTTFTPANIIDDFGDEILAALRSGIAQAPRIDSQAMLSALDEASNACLELAAEHGFATGHGDTVADMIREFSGQICSAKTPAPDPVQAMLEQEGPNKNTVAIWTQAGRHVSTSSRGGLAMPGIVTCQQCGNQHGEFANHRCQASAMTSAQTMLDEAIKRYPQDGGSHREAFIEGAKWAAPCFDNSAVEAIIKAARGCVGDYYVASGIVPTPEGDGYGALRELRLALEAHDIAALSRPHRGEK